MRRSVIPHAYHLVEINVNELLLADFVFLAIDDNPSRAMIAKWLETAGKPFIDVGMSLYEVDGSIGGQIRVTRWRIRGSRPRAQQCLCCRWERYPQRGPLMPRVERFDHEFVDQIPEDLNEGILYVSIRFGMVIHLCACGCGNQTVTPLGTTDYKLIYDGETITLHPSVGNWNFPCRSHYWVRRAKVVWADDWTDDQIRAGRTHDRYVKDQMLCEPLADAGGAAEAETQDDLYGSTADVTAVSPRSGLGGFAKRIAVYFRRRGRRHDGSGSQRA